MKLTALALCIVIQVALSQSLFPCMIRCMGDYTVGCSDGNVRCTTVNGIPQPLGESCYFNRCIDGKWSEMIVAEEGWSCVENHLVESTVCNPPPTPEECDFNGIRCLADENILVDGICTSRYQECINYVLSEPVTLPGILCRIESSL